MVRATPFQANLNSGEFSPRMEARVDFDRYPTACARAKNLICLPQGGLTARPGTRFVREIKNSSEPASLIPFIPTAGQSYMLEAGDEYIRFFRNQQQLVAEGISTSITNGTFDTDLTGWTDQSTGSGSISHDNGTMKIEGAGDGKGIAEQEVSVAGGDQDTVHYLAFEVTGSFNASLTLHIGTSSGDYDVLEMDGLGRGWHMIGFVPGASSVFIRFINSHAEPRELNIDNVAFLDDEPLEVPSPYQNEDAEDLRHVQSADVMYLFHRDYPPHKLMRWADTRWSLVRVFFEDGPWGEVNPGADLDSGNIIKNPALDSGTEFWELSRAGSSVSVEYDSSLPGISVVRTDGSAGSGRIDQQVTTGDPEAKHVIHVQISGEAVGPDAEVRIGTTQDGTDITSFAIEPGWYSKSFTPGVGNSTFWIQIFLKPTSVAQKSAVFLGGFLYNSHSNLLEPDSTEGRVTVTAAGGLHEPFRSTDVGRLLRLEWPGREPAWGVISSINSTASAVVDFFRKLPTDEPTETWRLGAWSDRTGWPRTGTFHEQRLFAAATGDQPQTLWASQSGDFENFRPDSYVEGAVTVEDDDGLDFTLSSTQVSPIRWMVSGRTLLLGTSSGQWSINSFDAVLTPQDFNAKSETSVGSADLSPVQIDEVSLFIHRALRAVYDIGFNFEIDGYRAADLTILADHIGDGRFAQLAYAAEPMSTVWARLENGKLAVMTYKRTQQVVGWTPVTIAGTDAEVESIGTIPGGSGNGQIYDSTDRDELWLIVKRTIDGSTKRYIEVMEGFFEGPNRAEYTDHDTWVSDVREEMADAFHVDAGATYQGAATSTITGLDHLEGETVKVVADGAVQSDKTVSSGQISLDEEAETVHVGLGYDWLFKSLKLPYGAQAGAGVTTTKTISKIGLVLKDSCGFEYGTETGQYQRRLETWSQPFRRPATPMDGPVELFTGEIDVDLDGGYDSDPRVVLKGAIPLPWTILGMAPNIRTNERL